MPSAPLTLADLTAHLRTPELPLVTYYDQATGERVELSGTTMSNWVAKTSNFLVDELDADRDTRVRIGLPSHWLRFVWILSSWNVGAAIVDASADIGVSGPDLVADEPQRVAASLRPLGARFAEAPEGFLDLGAEVPGHGDHFVPLDPPEADTLAVDVDGARTHADVLSTASPDARRLLLPIGSLQRDLTAITNACLGGGSLVIVSTPRAGEEAREELNRLADQEAAEVSTDIY